MQTRESWRLPTRPLFLSILLWAIGMVRWAVILTALLFLIVPLILDYLGAARTNLAAQYMYQGREYVLRRLGPDVRRLLPTHIAGRDRTEWVLIVGFVVLAGALGSLRYRIDRAATRRSLRAAVAAWKRDSGVPAQSAIGAELDAKVRELQSGKKVDRQELLKIFAETKRKLDSLGRDLAFLAIDVVGSTRMKEREDPAAIQHDFLEYRRLVEHVFRARGALKASWTPDGVMACFSHIDDAVQAGKDVIRALGPFNRSVKLMRADFAVRCGVNAGHVYFDDDTPMEAMSDRVIDLAGHMQKHAEPNTIAVPRDLVEPLRHDGGFRATQRIVDGYQVAAWIPGQSQR